MYCKDCKFYKTTEIIDKKIYKLENGSCHNENLKYGWELENESQLIYHDLEDYSAAINVGKLFGCVHFKKRRINESKRTN